MNQLEAEKQYEKILDDLFTNRMLLKLQMVSLYKEQDQLSEKDKKKRVRIIERNEESILRLVGQEAEVLRYITGNRNEFY